MTTQNGHTLLEILARDMEIWESESDEIYQNASGQICSTSGYRSSRGYEIPSDFRLATVKKSQWKEARTAYLASLISWRSLVQIQPGHPNMRH